MPAPRAPGAPPRVHFVTLGCPKNEVDSDAMSARVSASAYALTDSLDAADVVVLNTCAFIEAAAQESVDAALALASEWKAARAGRYVVVAGCLPSRYREELERAMPEADAFVPVAEETAILDVLERLTGRPAAAAAGPARLGGAPSAYLQISDGCHRRCTFCTIPSIRGPYRSRPLPDLLAEARLLVSTGAREIVLVGQDTSAYGRDLPAGPDGGRDGISEVVRSLARVDGLAWLRLMYVQPDGITDRLLEAMASEPAVCRYLDLPLQHASGAVLRTMGRSGDAESFLRLIATIREAIPGVVLRTSLITGFPGETEGDLDELEAFLREARLDYAGVFVYSPEEGTPAAALPSRLPEEERAERARRIGEVATGIGFERASSRVGRTLEVLAEGRDEEGLPVGRWRGQAPEVDGVVTFDASMPPGALTMVRVTEALGYDLVGEVQA